jgi:putative ABC transport system permease protein
MGIRLALGEQASGIVSRVVREAMLVVGLGLVAGACGALALGGVLRSLLYQVEPDDPRIHLIAVLVLAGAALVACLVPALRAASLDPARVLRED